MNARDILDGAHMGIIGINNDLNVYGGFDEIFDQAAGAGCPDWMRPEDWNEMPKEEKIVLADHMLALWQRYKDAAS